MLEAMLLMACSAVTMQTPEGVHSGIVCEPIQFDLSTMPGSYEGDIRPAVYVIERPEPTPVWSLASIEYDMDLVHYLNRPRRPQLELWQNTYLSPSGLTYSDEFYQYHYWA